MSNNNVDNTIEIDDNYTQSYIEQLKILNEKLIDKDSKIVSVQEDYKKIFNLSSDMIILLDDNGCVIDLNRKAQRILSRYIKEKTIIGKEWKNVLYEIGCNWDKSIEKQILNSDSLYEKTKEIYIKKMNKYYLLSIIPVRKPNDDSYFILTIKDVTNIKLRELNLIKKQKLLNYIYNITELFSKNLNINYIMDRIVETMANVNNVDMVYIYKNCNCNTTAEKIREYHKANLNINISDSIKYSDFPRWKDYFDINHIICGSVGDFPENEIELLKDKRDGNKIKSLCIVPIYTPLGLWGFLGFESYIDKKVWTFDEEQLLKIAANVIGGEIHKWNLRNINHSLEEIQTKCINI